MYRRIAQSTFIIGAYGPHAVLVLYSLGALLSMIFMCVCVGECDCSYFLFFSVQPARNLQTFGVDKRRVSYTFTASTTPGSSYKLTFTTNRDGITPPATQVLPRAGFRTISGLTPDVAYTLQVVAVRNGAESTAISADFATLPDGKTILP